MEKIDDIVREMRYGTVPKHQTDHELLAIFADRIEAAWEREAKAIATENAVLPAVCITKPSGNAAAMREVVYGIKNTANSALTALSIGNDMSSFLWDIIRKCEAALSAPARNCDLYKSEPEAYQAYLTAMKNATEKTYIYFEPWLFAEAKGGTI